MCSSPESIYANGPIEEESGVCIMKQGIDVRISPQAILTHPKLVTIGDHVAIDHFVVISTALEMGDYIHIAPFCSIIGGKHSKLILRDFSGLSAGCRIVCGSDDYKGEGLTNPPVPIEYREVTNSIVTLEKFAVLGTNVVVHPGVTVGEGAVVGSCSLVTRDLEPWGIYLGVPAKRVGDRRKDKILQYARLLLGQESSDSDARN